MKKIRKVSSAKKLMMIRKSYAKGYLQRVLAIRAKKWHDLMDRVDGRCWWCTNMSQVNTLGNPPRESPVGKCGQCTWYEGNMMRDYAYCLIVKHKVKSGSGGCHHWEANV